ncbi:MAG: zinc-binding dehydrogenase [Spirochaetales bacterium]|jgi:threonine dehydrogenase-like Zn-dependent dehydrogenase|nr:zinc-binding dehydrogenase [Spirochaetales bacterium]
MKASRVIAPGKIEIGEIPDPIPGPGEIVIRPRLLSLCGSDQYHLHYFPPESYPHQWGTSGHEMIGVIEAIGPDVKSLEIGEIVLGLAPRHTAMCELFKTENGNAVKLPEGAPIEELLMAQQLGTVIFALEKLPNLIGKTAVVIGQGSAGLFFDAMLKRLGVEKVIATDLEEPRLALAPSFGADDTFINTSDNAKAQVAEFTNGTMADLVIEAAGEIETINLAAHLVRKRGRILFFGIPRQETFMFNYAAFFRAYADVVSSSGAMDEPDKRVFRAALNLIATRKIPAGAMITHRFPFAELEAAYEIAGSRRDGAIKALIEMPGPA